ncbi:MAG: hypothetical protein AB1515_02490 [Nitrospirota bacterium]
METRNLLDVKDLLALRLTCVKCGASFSLPIADKFPRGIEMCPYCEYEWLPREGPARGPDLQAISHLLRGLHNLKAREKETLCHVQFEVAVPEIQNPEQDEEDT